MAAWPDAVGPQIARNAWPARFQRDGVLVVHTRDAIWAFELTQRAAEIRKRLDVTGLKFVPGPLPETTVDPRAAPPAPPPAASPEHRSRAADMAAGIEDDDLRTIVTKTIENALARAPNDRSF